MSTKLSKYCEGIIEAAWLAAVIVVPVFFNVYSSRIFEPDKITLLRTIALTILAAWIVKLLDEGGFRWERIPKGSSWHETLRQIPLIIPVLAVAIVYVVATVFSVTPSVSLAGSYQRLQGTYTTLSYIVVFAAMAGNLRRRAQVERLITTMIITSLPVSLYGVLQRYQIDPVPWAGDVTIRVASNMGNSIFVAAYLIMVSPLTLLRIVESFSAIMNDRGKLAANFARSTAYVFIAALQIITLLFSGSRGPLLGWLAGTFLLFVMLSLLWRQRWLTISVIVVAALLGVFLVLFNIPNGPFESLRAVPGIGRLGQLLDTDSRTGRVRTLIWQGAADLVMPHEPLEYPDESKDSFNFLRPLIGYGPESMYVAYNPFYPPGLTQVEKRNASPDRSHNETWDSLVITGALGLLAYLALFGAIFYYGLKWLGFITSSKQRNLFLVLYIGGGVLIALGFMLTMGAEFLGVALPFGMMLGVLLYLALVALSGQYEIPQTTGGQMKAITIAALLVAIMAHFAEINFGIAIAATRLYFWVFTALLLLVGYILPLYGAYDEEQMGEQEIEKVSPKNPNANKANSKRKRRQGSRGKSDSTNLQWPVWLRTALIGAGITGILLVTMGFDFITNRGGGNSVFQAVLTSLVHLPTANQAVSYGVLAMVLTTWLVAGFVLASEHARFEDTSTWAKILLTILGVSVAVALVYWLWHAAGLIDLANRPANDINGVLEQVAYIESFLTKYYIYFFLLVFALAFFLPVKWPVRVRGTSILGIAAAPVLLILVFYFALTTNLRVIQADIAFKSGDSFARPDTWPAAIAVYNHAIDLAPSEDFYYLFLGRAYLEHGKTLEDAKERDQLIAQAKDDLVKAQKINPLNTDHTANLARLYSLWSSFTPDPQTAETLGETSSDYFSKAVVLSPQNARLWDEWAVLYLNVFQDLDEVFDRLTQSLELDPYYDWTHALLGDYYTRLAQATDDPASEEQALQKAAEHYIQAFELAAKNDLHAKYNYLLVLANTHIQLNQPQLAIQAYEQALELGINQQDNWRIEETIGRIFAQMGDVEKALFWLTRALMSAPEEEKERLQSMVAQLETQR
ncbi:MAG: O-antigen ligase family protein [Anaerolineales bacterium]|nr:O-antigen ligase family protein [Anaerolineales bacterium]